jgi:hypothetical protein
MVERKLLWAFDKQGDEHDCEEVTRLKDQHEFTDRTDWAIYQAKVHYEIFGNIEKAIWILESEHSRVPRDASVMFCLAECCSRKKDRLLQALELCTNGLLVDASSDYGYTIKARVQRALGDPINCYRSAMEALKLNKRNLEAGIYLGVVGFAIALAEGDPEEMRSSIKNLRVTQTIFPQSRVVARLIEENEKRLGEFVGAGPEPAGP